MRTKLALAALVAGTAMVAASVAVHADPPGHSGFLCGFESTDDGGNGVLQPNEQFGEIHAGPELVADLNTPTENPSSGTLICSINVNSDSYLSGHQASVSGSGPVAIVIPPTPISYIAAAGSNVYLCVELITADSTGSGEHLYYDSTPDPADPAGQPIGFTTSSAAKCGLAISTG